MGYVKVVFKSYSPYYALRALFSRVMEWCIGGEILSVQNARDCVSETITIMKGNKYFSYSQNEAITLKKPRLSTFTTSFSSLIYIEFDIKQVFQGAIGAQ